MLLASALLAAATAAAPEPPPETIEIVVSGTPYGTEEFRRAEGPDGVALTGKVSMKVPGLGDAVLTQQTTLAADGHPLSYTLDVDAPGQQVVVHAAPKEGGLTLSITAKGATQPLRSQDVAAGGRVFLLDNNFGSHLDGLTRALRDLAPGEERAITALVPQILEALPATVKRGADGKGSVGGAAVATRTYRLTMANVGTELTARADDGALLQAEIPMQQALFKRRGYEAIAAAGPPGEPERFKPDTREKEIEVHGPAATLPGTLLIPKSEGPVPAVVFLSGSGPHDRDETIGPNKPFTDIARGLGDRGIASLRFDKRTFAIKDKSKLADALLKDEYYDDAKAAIEQLTKTSGIDPERIFVLGHSEGAMVAPKVAATSPPSRGVVMMAPGVRPIDAIVIDQMAQGAKLTGLSADDIADQTKLLKDKFAAIRDPKRLNTPPFMGASAAYWRDLIAVDVPKSVRESKLPILVLQGDEDVQVRKDLDFEILRTKVGTAGGRVTYRSFAGLNHLFMKVEHESTGAEYGFPAHVDPAVVSVIADWILLR